ncbi:MAG TPA: polysaccharide deacetylase family protein [Pseudomonadales bacterium]|nr:polysaccharide deacetylase family protein [Pseudomonadales bacterium]
MGKMVSSMQMRALSSVMGLVFVAAAGVVQADDHAVVLRYEEVAPNLNKQKGVSVDQFTAHIDYLEENGFTIWPLDKIVDYLRSGKPLPKNTVAITFDKASRSVYQNAFPVLKERRYPFTVFTVPKDALEDAKNSANWDELREMAANGAAIANLTYDYTYLVRQLDKETDKHWASRIRDEFAKANEMIQKEIGVSSNLVAYPYGEYDEKIRDIMKARRWVAFTTEPGGISAASDFAALPRISLNGYNADLKQFEVKLHSLPMPVASVESDKRIVDKKKNPPQLKLSLAEGSWPTDQFTCLLSGNGTKLPLKWDESKTSVTMKNTRALTPGRTSYTCTMPAGKNPYNGKPMQYVYSVQWMVPLANGKWYKE